MNAPVSIAARVEAYLAERRRAGFALTIAGTQLAAFARFADGLGHRGPLTLALAVQWACSSRDHRALTAARRIEVLRGFARYCQRDEPSTVIPPRRLFGPAHRRLRPHIYTEAEIARLIATTNKLHPPGGLRGASCAAIIGLMTASGLRISEATRLERADVDLEHGRLLIRQTKYGKSRWVPLHPTTVDALARYAARRDADSHAARRTAFFVFDYSRAASTHGVQYAFQFLRRAIGPARGGHPAPRLHDLRHTFVCRRLEQWYREGRDLDRHVLTLSTYVGHAKVTDTYWYVTATPELLALAAGRLSSADRSQP
ncbi:MAG: tyrosine-type recombinase/integrase [Burkholderiales bacterium]|nr:tyrosine-type recombinase/integrase [Burkholderiales bacterium]